MKNKKILILGMARSGIAIAKLLQKYENDITITDIKEQKEEIIKELKNLNIKIIISETQEELVNDSYDYIIKNPAIPKSHKAIQKAKELNIPVINEIEASIEFLPEDITMIGITGSNGKTTTTTITYELLKRTKNRVHIGGNIGIPLASIVDNIKPKDIVVLEISDHQLCDMYKFKTNISVLTNLSPVHLDFHENSYENYKAIKKRIFQNHTENDLAILNLENKDVLELTKDIPSQKKYFSKKQPTDIYLKENKIIYEKEEIISCEDIKIKGIHNYENIMIAILIAKKFGIKNQEIKEFLKEFPGVEHRIEFVRELKKRKFYNDSKATNNESTKIALKSFSKPILLIMGGLNRNIPFDDLSTSLENVKSILCYGETKEIIADFAKRNQKEVFILETLKEATEKAYELSEEEDVILLSPACASWDQFESFEKRGNEFKKIVKNLK